MSSDSAIDRLDEFDIVGVRKDGGADLVIVAQGPLDGSATTLSALDQKIRNYIREASSSAFLKKYELQADARLMIYISCAFPIDPAALRVIDRLQPLAARIGARIEVRKQMG